MIQLKSICEIRTNNFHDPDMAMKFDQLWNEATPYKLDGTVLYGVYSQYESNYKGDYTVGVYRESQIGDLNIDVNTAYKSYVVDHHDPMGVFKTWQKIWQEEDDGVINRAYTYDFEKYEADGTITIHIAIDTCL
ncbi:MAG: AraC family transcriptional regulator [Kurthia gibsonii]|uniref:AraC family transcriptional regulator n=1 Tax=Kurthia gibsonii TaxID=33946 RepID=A0ABU9LIF0_9BACL|nr:MULTISPECIES: hypothetical protein [Kurthia]AMA64218.1 hypothetical protein ASO14_2641 [Kurthia sp. 11kri321]MEB6113073.1 AraC family transcriptional regulator [Kurthia gibsonii]RXH52600.1 AraC family transcriptional regulator [Kurthia gibsonii]WIL38921.1 AraC family transcriptional regulator [Kurthia sp. YJT4]HZG11516.1 AraC family transcriptional regulator [Kurthia gibsonii]